MKIFISKHIDKAILVLFSCLIASIPIFSFQKQFFILTWGMFFLVAGLMIFSILLKKKFVVDFFAISFVAFAFSAFFSSLINGMVGFNFTPILLSFSTCLIYLYCKNTSESKNILYATYFGIILFLITFIFVYHKELLSFNFSKRLGGEFGDENDIAILFGFGFTFSVYLLLFTVGWKRKVLVAIVFVLFTYCGVSTGSKIIILLYAIVTILTVFIYFGKRRWWVSLLIVFGLGIVLFLILLLPPLETIRNRFLEMFATLSGNASVNDADYSTIFRLYMFADGIEMFLRKPLFGFGIWGFATYGGINNGWSHNHISEGLCNFGSIGFLLFHLPLVFSFINYFRTKERKDKFIGLFVLVFFCASMISISFFTQKIYAFTIGAVYSLLIGDNDIFKFQIFGGGKHENSSGN